MPKFLCITASKSKKIKEGNVFIGVSLAKKKRIYCE
jgi:hypothetical protein